jgi:GNAT superfamily N-acetyltransferase
MNKEKNDGKKLVSGIRNPTSKRSASKLFDRFKDIFKSESRTCLIDSPQKFAENAAVAAGMPAPSVHGPITAEKAGKAHRNAILSIGATVFTPDDLVGLEIQLNDYFKCPEPLRSVQHLNLESVRRMNGLVRQEWFIFRLQKMVFGFSGLEISLFDGPSKIVWLNWTGIARRFHRNGFGKTMVDFMSRRAKDGGYDYMGVKTCHIYGPAIALYEKCGFTFSGKIDHYFGEDEPLLIYMKDLRQST